MAGPQMNADYPLSAVRRDRSQHPNTGRDSRESYEARQDHREDLTVAAADLTGIRQML